MNRVSLFRRAFGVFAAVIATFSLETSSPAQATNSPPPAPRRPNIIFILADDLGYGDLGCYGQKKIGTPALDRLASEGIRFTSFYAGSTVCAPSRAALMLGQHTGHLNLRGNAPHGTLLPDEVTVAQVLNQSGYHTGLIGKWGLSDEGLPGVPQKKGFDEFVGYLNNVHAHDYFTDYLWRYDPPSATKRGFDGRIEFSENQGGKKGLYIPDLCTTAALNFVRNNKPDQFNRFRPFFLCLNYTTPHANNQLGNRTGNGMEVPTDAPYSNEPWPQAEKNKAAMITRMDADIGKLVAKLKELKIDDDTVIFFSSDNGPHKEGGVAPNFFQSSGPFRGLKRDLTDGGIRVPMLVRWPAKIKPGQVSDFVWAAWDFLPTAAEIARVEPPKGMDGISVLPLLLGGTQTNRHELFYWEFHEQGFQQAVRVGDWKAIRAQAGEKLELYDVKADPGEKEDVADKNPETVKKIEELLKTARTGSDRWPIKQPPKEENPDKPKAWRGGDPFHAAESRV
ncbi:MAG: arylsulfatase [Verrucomicrobia bacterium]|nr:arylsulfatase [Verrucomicrobiota bacterium]